MKYSYRISYKFTTLNSEGVGSIGVTLQSEIATLANLREIESSIKEQFGYTYCIVTGYDLLSNR